jgi:hypothetical protein
VLDAPFKVTLDGLNEQVDSVGKPEHAKLTVGLNPTIGSGATVRVVWTFCPRVTVRIDEAGVTVRSTTIKAMGGEEEPAKLVSPLYRAVTE